MNRKWTGTKWAERENKGEMGDKRRWERGRKKGKNKKECPGFQLLTFSLIIQSFTT